MAVLVVVPLAALTIPIAMLLLAVLVDVGVCAWVALSIFHDEVGPWMRRESARVFDVLRHPHLPVPHRAR